MNVLSSAIACVIHVRVWLDAHLDALFLGHLVCDDRVDLVTHQREDPLVRRLVLVAGHGEGDEVEVLRGVDGAHHAEVVLFEHEPVRKVDAHQRREAAALLPVGVQEEVLGGEDDADVAARDLGLPLGEPLLPFALASARIRSFSATTADTSWAVGAVAIG